jgi:hypothetical protein
LWSGGFVALAVVAKIATDAIARNKVANTIPARRRPMPERYPARAKKMWHMYADVLRVRDERDSV